MAKAKKDTPEVIDQDVKPTESQSGDPIQEENTQSDEILINDNADDNHLDVEEAREEITEFNEGVESGHIPADSTDSIDVALEKVKTTEDVETDKSGSESDDSKESKDGSVLEMILNNTENGDSAISGNEASAKITEAIKPDYKAKAAELIKEHNLKEIWRDPVTGYWNVSLQNVEELEKKYKRSFEHYK